MTTRRRAGRLATAALMAAGLTGCGSSASSPHAAGSPSSTASATPTTASTSPTSAVTPSPTSTAPAAALTAAQLLAVRTSTLEVFGAYESVGTNVKLGTSGGVVDVAAYFADQTAAGKFQGGGGIGAPMGCGAASGKSSGTNVVNGVVIGMPVATQDAISVPVSLYTGTNLAARLSVTADATGKLEDFSCGAVAGPDLPGVATIVGFYGGFVAAGTDAAADAKISQLKQQFVNPAFLNWQWTGVDADHLTCGQDVMTAWHAAYTPDSTATTPGGAATSQWHFQPGPTAGAGLGMTVTVDPAVDHITWVDCLGDLPPVANPADQSKDQITQYADSILNGYAYLLALMPLGADPTVIEQYFVSEGAYKTSADSSGIQPLECSKTVAGGITIDSVTVSESTAVITATVGASWHPVDASSGEQALGHLKATLDLASMKLVSVSCD